MSSGIFRNNGVAPKDKMSDEDSKTKYVFSKYFVSVRDRFSKGNEDNSPPKTWKEMLTFTAENAKGDREAPSYLFGHLRCYLVFDTETDFHYRWLMLVNFVVLYNLIFVIARSCFWEMENIMPVGWLGMVDNLDNLLWFKYNSSHKSPIFCFAQLLLQILVNFQNQGQI